MFKNAIEWIENHHRIGGTQHTPPPHTKPLILSFSFIIKRFEAINTLKIFNVKLKIVIFML